MNGYKKLEALMAKVERIDKEADVCLKQAKIVYKKAVAIRSKVNKRLK
jgi:uncharacterized protein (UPF0335 family)